MSNKSVFERLKERALKRLEKEGIRPSKEWEKNFVQEFRNLGSQYISEPEYLEEEKREKEKKKEKIKNLNLQIKEIIKKSLSKEEIQKDQIRKLIQYTKTKRPFLKFAETDPRLVNLRKKIEIISGKKPKSVQISKLRWLIRQAKNRALAGDWYGAQEAFCYLRNAYHKIIQK